MKHRSSRLVVLSAAIVALCASTVSVAQDLHPSRRPSPLGSASTHIGDAYVRIVFSQPYKRDRDNIFGTKESGALVPYGERWRTGANEATEITFNKALMIAGKKLPAGIYSVTTTPGADSWTVHFNSELGLDGLGHFDRAAGKFTPVDLAKSDVLVVTAKPTAIPADQDEVDQFKITFEKNGSGQDLVMRWVRTEVRVPISAAM
ncbi:MAG: DUF2911 domain-containing protein [Thermoanaerobaculia bacterium]